MQRLIRDVKAGRIDVVVFHRVDRIFRNLKSLLEFVDLLKKNNVRLVSVTEKIDTDTWWGRLVLAVLGSLAEAYLWQTSANITEALGKRRSKGNHLGRIPLGYCNGLCSTCTDHHGPNFCPLIEGKDRPESQRGRVAVPHPLTRHAIPWIFDLFQKGHSYREIAEWLNSHDFILPDGQSIRYQTKAKTLSNPLGLFARYSIRAIIENSFFAGLVARYERPELDMDDDTEYDSNIVTGMDMDEIADDQDYFDK